jgi:hypothetical protein
MAGSRRRCRMRASRYSTAASRLGLMVRDGVKAPPHHEGLASCRLSRPHPEEPRSGVSKDGPRMKLLARVIVPAARNARALHQRCPSSNRGRRECRCFNRTRSLACKWKKHASKSPQVRRNDPALPAQWCYGLSRALPGEPGFVATVTREVVHGLDPSVGGSGPRAFAVRFCRARPLRRKRPSHPAANARDDRETPLLNRARDGGQVAYSPLPKKRNIFRLRAGQAKSA